jgi:hypothetical protein
MLTLPASPRQQHEKFFASFFQKRRLFFLVFMDPIHMTGSIADFIRRMQLVLPTRWFADSSPTTQAVLGGAGTAWSWTYGLIQTVRMLARIATSSGIFLDLISTDFFATSLPRWPSEGDAGFLARIQNEMLRPRATRAALALALTQLTGRAPVIFEPVRPEDTGGYTLGGVGYGVAGGWGNLSLRHASFVTAWRPLGSGIADVAGYGTGGPLAYGNLSQVAVPVSDSSIFAQAAAVIPVGHTAWMRLEG